MSTKTFSVPGISCGHCVNTIQRELKMVNGVEDVKADQNTKQVTVTVASEATLQNVFKTLDEIGYPVAN